MTYDPEFKVTIFLKSNIGKPARFKVSYYCTRGNYIYLTWNGTMFGDFDWPLNASRGLVSVS